MSNLISPANVNFTRCNNLCIYKGSFWSIPISLCSRDNLIDTPIDISGYTGVAAIKRKLSDDVPVAMPTITIDPDNVGTFTISLSSNLTQNIPTSGKSFSDVNEYYYEIDFIDNISQESYRSLYGIVEVVNAAIDSDDGEN